MLMLALLAFCGQAGCDFQLALPVFRPEWTHAQTSVLKSFTTRVLRKMSTYATPALGVSSLDQRP